MGSWISTRSPRSASTSVWVARVSAATGTSVDSTALRGEQIAQQLAAPASRGRDQVRPGAKSSRDHRHVHGLAARRFERL